MIIAHIEGATRICGKAQGYLGLPLRDELISDTVNGEATPAMVTAWTPTPEELAALHSGASVHVRILGTTPPPMMVLVGPAPDPAAPVPRSSADKENEIDFSDPFASKVMGAARLHTHDHEMAYNITREVLAALSSDLPQPPNKMLTMLAILDAAGGQTEASDSKWCWLNYFCDDVEPVDTFNQAIDAKLIRVTHESSFDTSTAFLTDAGRAALSLPRPNQPTGNAAE
ncbi:hypothetical protein AB7M69_006546 [Bradyrhizobium japonicum]